MGYLATGALCLALACCLGARGGSTRKPVKHIPSEDRFNFFDLELLQNIAQTQEGNMVVSPVSVKATLAMLLEGAGGATAAQLRTALRLPEHQTGVQVVMKNYLSSLRVPSSGYKLDLANQVFMSRMLTPNPSYVNTLNANYFAGVTPVDFTQREKTAGDINTWVKQLTRGLIPTLVDADSLQPDSQVMVANAVYFKGKWKIPFDSSGTVPRNFCQLPEKCRKVNMMEALGYYNYAYVEALDAFALELPYEGDKFSMLVVLPKTQDGIAQLVRDIAHERMHNVIRVLAMTEVVVMVPRFEIEFSNDLVPTLTALGVVDIFSPQSNLTGLFAGAEASAQVSNVFHKAKIIVNEEGSEAGAGTGALVIPLMGGSVMPKFRADHPFLFFIRDVTTGVLVFAGRVNEPDEAPSEHFQGNVDAAFGQPPAASTTRRSSTRRTTRRTTTPPPTTEGTFLPSHNADASPPKQQQRPQIFTHPPSATQRPSYSQVASAQVPSGSQNPAPLSYPQGGVQRPEQIFVSQNSPPPSPALQRLPPQHQPPREQNVNPTVDSQAWKFGDSSRSPSGQNTRIEGLALSAYDLNPTNTAPRQQTPHSHQNTNNQYRGGQQQANGQGMHTRNAAPTRTNADTRHTNADTRHTNADTRHTNADQDTNKQYQINVTPQYPNAQNSLADSRIHNTNAGNAAQGQVPQYAYEQNPGVVYSSQLYPTQQDRRENPQHSNNFQQPNAQPSQNQRTGQYMPTALPVPTNQFIQANNAQFQTPLQANGYQQYSPANENVVVQKAVDYRQHVNLDALRYDGPTQNHN